MPLLQEKEGLITELRKELRVSDDEHRELLTKVHGDQLIKSIRLDASLRELQCWALVISYMKKSVNFCRLIGYCLDNFIRDWRQAGGHQAARLANSQPVHDLLPSPSVSASRKRHKATQSVSSLSFSALHLLFGLFSPLSLLSY